MASIQSVMYLFVYSFFVKCRWVRRKPMRERTTLFLQSTMRVFVINLPNSLYIRSGHMVVLREKKTRDSLFFLFPHSFRLIAVRTKPSIAYTRDTFPPHIDESSRSIYFQNIPSEKLSVRNVIHLLYRSLLVDNDDD